MSGGSIRIVIPGAAQAKGRPRLAVIAGHARAFTPAKTRSKEGVVAVLAMEVMGGRPPLTGPVAMEVCATLVPAASWPKKRRTAALAGEVRPTKKPDLDNALKLIWDALNGVVYADDAQVVAVSARKVYGEVAETIVTVRPLDGGAA